MESRYFPTPEFQEALGAYVLLRVNATGSASEQALYARLAGGEALPTYAVLEADGTLLARTGWTGGTHAGDTLLAWLREHAR